MGRDRARFPCSGRAPARSGQRLFGRDPTIWAESPLSRHFHAVSFSCLTGHRKPEPQAYLTAIRGLGVDARDCIFVGDGSSQELTGAAQLGMRVYRFRPEAVDMRDSIDADETWTGQTSYDLQELVAIASR